MNKVFLMFLISTLLLSIFLVQDGSTLTRSKVFSQRNYATNSLILINQTEYVWYGDFIVNEVDSVIVENCKFTVVDGSIYVYGELNMTNSTIHIQESVYRKQIQVSGVFILSGSSVIGLGRILLQGGTFISNNSTLVSWNIQVEGGVIQVFDSKISQICIIQSCSLTISNSEVPFLLVALMGDIYPYPGVCGEILNSSIDKLYLSLYDYYVQFENINEGFVEDWIFSNSFSNLTIEHSIIKGWYICPIDECRSLSILNSVVNIEFELDGCENQQFDLTLQTGFFHYKNIYLAGHINMTITNSTINSWTCDCLLTGGAFHFSNSNCSISVFPLDYSVVLPCVFVVSNSTVPWLSIWYYAGFAGNLTLIDSEVETLSLRSEKTRNFVLNTGFQQYLSLYDPQQNSNITFIRTKVNHWGLLALSKAIFNVSNSNILGTFIYDDIVRVERAGILMDQGSEVHVYNSNVTCVRVLGTSSLTLVNSTIQLLYAYGDANITAIDSTIITIIRDPPILNLINSQLQADIILPFQMSEERLYARMLDNFDITLPTKLIRASKYLQINTTYNDDLNAQVRIYYNETEVDENNLQMYVLDESKIWQPCTVQGVNTMENYVWANVTYFSCFVVVSPPVNLAIRTFGWGEISSSVWIDNEQPTYCSPINMRISIGQHTVKVSYGFLEAGPEEGSYIKYSFYCWDNGSTNNTRSIQLEKDRTIWALYKWKIIYLW
jgi:hypothetical protein